MTAILDTLIWKQGGHTLDVNSRYVNLVEQDQHLRTNILAMQNPGR